MKQYKIAIQNIGKNDNNMSNVSNEDIKDLRNDYRLFFGKSD